MRDFFSNPFEKKPWMYTKPEGNNLSKTWFSEWQRFFLDYCHANRIHLISRTDLKQLNPFDRPSSIIDVTQWLGLVISYKQQSEEANLEEKHRLLTESLIFTNEALKFYQPGSPYPPDNSYFNRPKGIEITEAIRADTSVEKLVNLKFEIEEELTELQKCQAH